MDKLKMNYNAGMDKLTAFGQDKWVYAAIGVSVVSLVLDLVAFLVDDLAVFTFTYAGGTTNVVYDNHYGFSSYAAYEDGELSKDPSDPTFTNPKEYADIKKNSNTGKYSDAGQIIMD